MCLLLGMSKQLVYAFPGFYNKETISSNNGFNSSSYSFFETRTIEREKVWARKIVFNHQKRLEFIGNQDVTDSLKIDI